MKFRCGHPSARTPNTLLVGNICNISPVSRYIAETLQHKDTSYLLLTKISSYIRDLLNDDI